MRDEKAVLHGIEVLQGALPRGSIMSYVLIGFNTTHEEDYYRVMKLREKGVDPFVMPFNKKDRRQKRFARWANHKAVFKSVSWEDYHR